MNNTIQVTIAIDDNHLREEVIAQLTTLQFDAFEEKEHQLEAFIKEEKFDSKALSEILLPYNLTGNSIIIEEQNWNALWESNFQPVVVDSFCAIRADFHPPFTNVAHEIIITPKMSFGTGHHATTYMMISQMQNIDFRHKQVADFGTGTGILAILAEQLGSERVWAIDYDYWSIENSKENISRNCCKKVVIENKDRFLTDQKFDIILANINKHVILNNVQGIFCSLNKKGKLVISGLLKDDRDDIISAFSSRGLQYISTADRNNWICLLFENN
ncbi:MAG TPA: 50S ribosomal protein L11 methyltransferase [Segetibacter sp.]|jgi:ribosomal protein L11 methyltransferase